MNSYTIEELNEYFYYKDGDLFRKKKTELAYNTNLHTPLRTLVGKKGKQYYSCKFKNKPRKVHRLIYEIINQELLPDNLVIDHKDGNNLNNMISNLRAVKQTENLKNMKTFKNNTVGFRGVSMDKNRFRARIWDNTKCHSKSFATLDEAIKWRLEMEKTLNFHENHGRIVE